MKSCIGLFSTLCSAVWAFGGVTDSVQFGQPLSEKAHELNAVHSEVFTGGLGIKARRFLPKDEETWRGGHATFEMKVDAELQNYCTVKMWGGYAAENGAGRMSLSIEGKQVGQRHLGEIDMLDVARDEPRFDGRFFYKTVPLPYAMTQGKERVQLSIEAQGPIWAYGSKVELFQKMMTIPSRGIYRAYTHTEPYFEPAEEEIQGVAVSHPPIRSDDKRDVILKIEKRVNDELEQLMKGDAHMGQQAISFMGRAYFEPWTPVYRSKKALEKMIEAIDCQYRVYTGALERKEGHFWKQDWAGFGRTADAVRLLKKELQPYLNQCIGGSDVLRKVGWADMFAASRDIHSGKRRQYTNQSMIVDTYGIYLCNRGVAAVDSQRAWSEEKALRVMYESMGIEPWSGEWDAAGNPNWRMGHEYLQFTEAGLSKELGYVGNYGEAVVSLGTEMYDATRPSYYEEGDARIKDQLVKMAKARAVFRCPGIDDAGNRAMRIETVIGWRDYYFPGSITYDERPDRESMPFGAAAATLDPILVGYAQHMLEDNQYFSALEKMMKNGAFEVTALLLNAPSAYRAIISQQKQSIRVPMADGEADFVFSDPEDGVVAIKNGENVLFISLYWRARYAINHLAKIHHITPQIERDVIAREETRFNDSGNVFVMPDQVNEPFSRRHESFYKAEGLYLAEAGIQQPIAKVPERFKEYKPGKENVFAGKGTFYLLEYGDYLIAMNCTKDQSFDFELPDAFKHSKDLVSGNTFDVQQASAGPRRTIVLVK